MKIKTLCAYIALTAFTTASCLAGTLSGKIIDKSGKYGIPYAKIKIKEIDKTILTDSEGKFKIDDIEDGNYTIIISANNRKDIRMDNIEISKANKPLTIEMQEKEFSLGDIVVYGASKRNEKITESPAAVTVQYPAEINRISRKGQIARSFDGVTGVDVLQSGSTDFIVNTRGFNNGLNRRILVLQDGRDAAMPLLGAQEWNSFSMPLDEFAKVELVRGPSAALYGANAFNGVLNLTSYAPNEIVGTKVSLMGGEYETFRADVRHAGVIGNFGYKVTLGTQGALNYAKRRDSVQFLEYQGLVDAGYLERRPIKEDERNTFSHYGTFRADYNFTPTERIVSEFGYSRSGNEAYVFGLGRTFVKDVERPYLRLGYNSERINIHAHYMQRQVKDTMWLLVPNAPLLDNSKDFLVDFQHNFDIVKDFNIVWGISQQFQQIRTSGTSIPNNVDANYTGAYAQFDWRISPLLKLVASSRADFSNIHNNQFSPRIALVVSPKPEHQIRFALVRAFQRPNYSELYRSTLDAPAMQMVNGKPVPVNFSNVYNKIADSIQTLTGSRPDMAFLGLSPFNARAVGNKNLDVEKTNGIEIGYKGIIENKLFITADIYYNRINDFITNFLPGVNKDIESWQPAMPDSLSAYSGLVKDMVLASLSPRDRARLSMLDGKPTFVVSNANVGEVEQFGMELGMNYYFTDELSVGANYSYYDYSVIKSNTSQPLLPNTSPNKFNISASYAVPKSWDATVSFNYTEGFDWIAGTYEGSVPSYALVNLNGGVYLTDNFQLGLNIFNLLNRKHYQIFGGTYLPRQATARITYEL